MGTLKPAMSLRAGTLSKHLQLDKNFADSVDSGATLSADEEASMKDDETETARYMLSLSSSSSSSSSLSSSLLLLLLLLIMLC